MEFTIGPDGAMKPQPGTEQVAPAAATSPGAAPGATPAAAVGALISDSDTQRFMVDVIEASRTVPVIVDFWAPWCGPCKQLGPLLERLVLAAAGAVKLVKINVDENQDLAAQLRVQSIPMVYGFKGGQPVDSFTGALPESQLKAFIEKLTDGAKAPIDVALDEAQAALDAGDGNTAAAIFAQVRSQAPDNERAIAGLIRAALATGAAEQAQQMVDGLPDDWRAKTEIAAAITALELTGNGADSAELQALHERLEADQANPEARFELANALFAAGQNEAAIEQLIELVRRHRAWNEEAARMQLLKIFEALGPAHADTVAGRRALSSVLFS